MNQLFWDKLKRLLGFRPAGEYVDVRDEDTFLVSYPKSGNTWLRFLVANLVSNGNKLVDLSNIEEIVPDIYLHNIFHFNNLPSPRYLKSHECFNPKYKKVIYIVRDPRDVVISYWRFQIKKQYIPEDYSLENFIAEFINGEIRGAFGSWRMHVGSWLGARENDPNFLLIKYEDLFSNPEYEVKKIANQLRISTNPDKIERTIEQSSFNRLKSLEKIQGSKWKALDGTRTNENFFRKGQIGAWKSIIPDRQAQMINYEWGDLLRKLGYFDS